MNRCQSCFCEYGDEFNICPECGYTVGVQENPIYRLPHGSVINNRYIIGKTIGSGGFGITYKAWDMKLETIVAVKEYYPLGMVNRVPGTREVTLVSKKRVTDYNNGYTRFLDEARNMAKFNGNANIVNVFEFFEENGTAYIVMEFLEGQDLKGFLTNMGGKLDVETSVLVISEISKALETIHKKGIIHRDISPDNIFICTNNSIKLIDFGAARFSESGDKNLTIILKPGFAPPEQYEKVNEQGPWTDIYALGATMYMILTGYKPDESTNRKIKDELMSPNMIVSEIPENISNSVMKAMAVDKHLRFPNMAEFRKAIQGEKKVISVAREKKKRKKRRIIGILAAVAVVATGFGIFMASWEKQKEEETLPEASVDVWYMADVNTSSGAAKQVAMEAIATEFMRSYDTVTLNLVPMEAEEYKAKLKEALESKENVPEVFESTSLDSEYMSSAQDISDVIDNVEDRIYFSDELEAYSDDKKKAVTGFKLPVLYINTILFTEDTDIEPENVTLNDVLATVTLSEIKAMIDVEAFLGSEQLALYGSSADYTEVQAALPAQYKMFAVGDDAQCIFGDSWSMNSCTEDEQKVALKLIEYFYSDNAQDMMFVQNNTELLPVNRGVLKVYEQVFMEYSGYFDEIDDFEIEE